MGSLFSLEGKVAIFAGASKETGRTIAIEMAKAGADVVVSARTVEGIENAAAEIRSLGRRSLAVPTDVREAAIDNEPHYRYTPNSLHDRKLRYHSREISGSVKWFSLRRGRMRVLVTGGAGRLGISVCRMLQKKGFEVRVFDLNSERNRKSVKELGSKAEVFWGDITDADSVRQAVEGVDAVIHMAGILPPVTEANPGLAAKVNVGGTKTLVDAIRKREKRIPFVFTSSVAVFGPTTAATEPISVEKNAPDPKDVYGQTKLKAENLIRESGIDYVILRLSAAMYTVFELSDVRRLYGIPLDNRLEICHPDEVSLAIVNAIVNFETAKGNMLIISGGPKGRMLYKDMVGGILGVLRLPLPPARKFTQQPFYLDWYDTSKSQLLLQYQHKTFGDYLGDYRGALSRRFSPAFLPFMCYFVGPVFGKLVMRLM